MTTEKLLAPRRTAVPKRNWAGVLLAVTGAVFCLGSLINGVSRSIVDFPTNLFGPIFGVQAGLFIIAPIALVVAFVPLAFGTQQMAGIVGFNMRARLWLFATPFVAIAAQVIAVGLLISQLGAYDPAATARAEIGGAVAVVIALLFALVAGIIVARAHVVGGAGRWALIVAVVLVAVTLLGAYTADSSDWVALPYGVGILILGLSYWRAGLVRRAPSHLG